MPDERIDTVEEVQDASIVCTLKRVRNWIKSGQLRATKLWQPWISHHPVGIRPVPT